MKKRKKKPWQLIAMDADKITVFAMPLTVKADVVTLSVSTHSQLTLASEMWHHSTNLDEDKKPVVNGNLS